jgi:aminomethyltransferase
VAEGRQPPRHDDAVLDGDARVGTVTSGNFSPVLGRGIALALIDTGAGGQKSDVKEGDGLMLDVRGRHLPARVSALPFVRAGHGAGKSGAGQAGAGS